MFIVVFYIFSDQGYEIVMKVLKVTKYTLLFENSCFIIILLKMSSFFSK